MASKKVYFNDHEEIRSLINSVLESESEKSDSDNEDDLYLTIIIFLMMTIIVPAVEMKVIVKMRTMTELGLQHLNA
jgi:hypothetical protein